LERLDERLLVEDVQTGVESGEEELVVRRRRRRDREDVRLPALEQLVEARVGRLPGLALPRRALLRRAVEAADDLDLGHLPEGGQVEAARRPAESREAEAHLGRVLRGEDVEEGADREQAGADGRIAASAVVGPHESELEAAVELLRPRRDLRRHDARP